ncbi:hypothetical protein [Candidatus Poriferisodalis sp.]|uniref:hypothetical protein n=1 Tax=Candidatus Poriferisodalis sp. TaxID=3101277 RepID=UPI003B01DF22
MSSRRHRKASRTRRLGGAAAQQRQAAEASAKFWHGSTSAPVAGENAVRPADADVDRPSAGAVMTSEGTEQLGEISRISVTPDPTSTVRSLGKPPLVGREMAAERYFEAVYQRAVALAAALAAAGDLLDDSDGTLTSS